MDTRALGKALGRTSLCLPIRPPPPACARLATSMFAVLLWLVCCGIGGDPDSAADGLPAFGDVRPVAAKKSRFFEFLTPIIRTENERIRRQRGRLRDLAQAWRSGEKLAAADADFLGDLARHYRLDPDALQLEDLMTKLLLRVDVIPRSLVLVQAAKESAWGSSRFARHANNLFGQHCFEQGCGMVPRQRPQGMTHEVKSFDSVRASVASYMRNLNTHPSYRTFRALRARMRAAGLPLSGVRLAEGLVPYSERGNVYVREVQSMIRQNDLETTDVAALTGS